MSIYIYIYICQYIHMSIYLMSVDSLCNFDVYSRVQWDLVVIKEIEESLEKEDVTARR